MINEMLALLNARKNKILQVAEAALPDRQFLAFKKIFLDELGRQGFESDLIALMQRSGSGVEMGGKISCRKGGAKMIEQSKKS